MKSSHPRSVTREELRAELKNFATKAELRAELEKFATKAELRAELEKFATKEDLQAVRDALALEIMKLDVRIDRKIEAMASKADEATDRILTAIDSFAGERVAHRNKMTLHGERLRRIEVKVFGSSPPPPDED